MDEANSEPAGEPDSEASSEPTGEPRGEANSLPTGETSREPTGEPGGQANSLPADETSGQGGQLGRRVGAVSVGVSWGLWVLGTGRGCGCGCCGGSGFYCLAGVLCD